MYEYSKESNPLRIQLHNTEVQLDNLPTQHPFVPRICEERGYFIIWYGSPNSDPDLVAHSLKCKNDPQWVSCSEEWMIEKGVALVYPYEDETIIGSVKVAGYMNNRPRAEVRRYIKSLWRDIIEQFGGKRIVCPAGSYLEYLHLSINQKRIPHDAYLASLMIQNGFERHEHYWVRDGSDHKTD
jgi:hypothetical protein